jgi:hypothetical protein
LSHILISLPVAVLPLLAGAPHLSAGTASNAVSLLAQSKAVDRRCHHLSDADHQQLSDYVARAEVIGARLEGAGAMKSALASGARKGSAMSCDGESKSLVLATLNAARRADQALAAQSRNTRQASNTPSQQSRTVEKTRQPARTVAMQPPQPRQPDVRPDARMHRGGALGHYTQLAAAYYIERRCGFLASRDTMTFWKLIVARHNAMIDAYGGSAVTDAKAEAEQAGSAACSRESEAFVRSAWNDIQQVR